MTRLALSDIAITLISPKMSIEVPSLSYTVAALAEVSEQIEATHVARINFFMKNLISWFKIRFLLILAQ